MTSRERKRKKTMTKNPTPRPELIPSLPDDLMLSCLARVSRLYYPSLSLVSKRFRSLLASPELYVTRSLLGHTECCLYVCLEVHGDNYPRWFTLCRKPDPKKKKKKKKSSSNLLVPISSPLSPPLSRWSCFVALSSNIYRIGGHIDPSSSVSILDCRSHTWRKAPSLMVERSGPSASVVDGKIYVVGGCQDGSIEVFDSKTQTWDLVTNPDPALKVSSGRVTRSACIEGKVHLMCGPNGLAFDPKEGIWDTIQPNLTWNWKGPYCVVENILFSYFEGVLLWYDASEVRLWKKLRGLRGLPKLNRFAHVRLTDYGGKMVVLWDKNLYSSSNEKNTIWCAEIALERRNKYEIWGKVEWLDAVLRVPAPHYLMKVLAASL